MRFRSDSQRDPDIPTPAQTLEQIQQQLTTQQQTWAKQLDRDPTAFAQLEPQIPLAFGQLADQLVASLLAHAAQQPALADAAKKK
jgi:hypothetical protein